MALLFGDGFEACFERQAGAPAIRSSLRRCCCTGTVSQRAVEADAPSDPGVYEAESHETVRIHLERDPLAAVAWTVRVEQARFGSSRSSCVLMVLAVAVVTAGRC